MLLSHARIWSVPSQGKVIIVSVHAPPNRGPLHLSSHSPSLLVTGLEFHKYCKCELPLVTSLSWNLQQSILSQDGVSQQDQASKC